MPSTSPAIASAPIRSATWSSALSPWMRWTARASAHRSWSSVTRSQRRRRHGPGEGRNQGRRDGPEPRQQHGRLRNLRTRHRSRRANLENLPVQHRLDDAVPNHHGNDSRPSSGYYGSLRRLAHPDARTREATGRARPAAPRRTEVFACSHLSAFGRWGEPTARLPLTGM